MYDFDKIVNRFNTTSLKWDIDKDELPMWVADMDFAVCDEITKAMKKRMECEVFGYNIIPDEWYNAYINWWKNRHNFEIKKDWLLFSTGVVPSISSIVRRMTRPAEKVILQTPVYNIFFNSIYNNGRYILESPLVYENNEYHIDFNDLEEKLADPQTTLMILCNPHNPVGKIWDFDTLKKIGDLCVKHNVIVLSDEIHCDITLPNKNYIPFASVSDNCKNNSITCIAPTKAFNIAGLQTSAIVIPNENIRNKVNRGINNDEIAEPNTFACYVAIAAFNYGGTWLDELKAYLEENRKIAYDFIKKELPMLAIVQQDATYLLWINCSKVCNDSVLLTKFIRKETGLFLSDGFEYGKTGIDFIRMNIACPKKRLLDGLNRFKNGINKYLKTKKAAA